MASFKGRDGIDWRITLDAPTIEEIRSEYGISLVDLEKDPLGKVQADPMLLVTIISTVCRDQIDERKLSPREFAKQLPSPPDPMIEALRDAVISFFPSGRASHVREVLAKFDQMSEKTNQIAVLKMQQILDDPKTTKTLNAKADEEITKAMTKLTGQSAGT